MARLHTKLKAPYLLVQKLVPGMIERVNGATLTVGGGVQAIKPAA